MCVSTMYVGIMYAGIVRLAERFDRRQRLLLGKQVLNQVAVGGDRIRRFRIRLAEWLTFKTVPS